MYNKIECPYCEHEFEDENYVESLNNDNTYDLECPNCNKEMEVTVEWEPSFSACEIEYYDCIECGSNYRFTGDWRPYPRKYNDVRKDLRICDECRGKLLSKEYEEEYILKSSNLESSWSDRCISCRFLHNQNAKCKNEKSHMYNLHIEKVRNQNCRYWRYGC